VRLEADLIRSTPTPGDRLWVAATVTVVMVDVVVFAALARGAQPSGVSEAAFISSQLAAWTVLAAGLLICALLVLGRYIPSALRRRAIARRLPSARVVSIRATDVLRTVLVQQNPQASQLIRRSGSFSLAVSARSLSVWSGGGDAKQLVDIPRETVSVFDVVNRQVASRLRSVLRVNVLDWESPVELIVGGRMLGALPAKEQELRSLVASSEAPAR